MSFITPKGYRPTLPGRETETAIKFIRDAFQRELTEKLNLQRISAPLFVRPETGLNDNLNGVERPVSFDVPALGGGVCEIVHSLAKWKRMTLGKYGFVPGEGLYTDMNAIRRDEELDNLHSMYVDQWDWCRVIRREERSEETLRETVRIIYDAIRHTQEAVSAKYPVLENCLPEEISFVTTQALLDMYPRLSPKEREYRIVKDNGAVFLMQIGDVLSNGEKHDGRAPDYDDWALNGDILVYYPVLDTAFELSSMGVRVDADSLRRQCAQAEATDRLELEFHKGILDETLPFTIGGGIGQSRLCMFMLGKAHIGEVQASVWDEETLRICKDNGISLL